MKDLHLFSRLERGAIKKITFEIEYPNGDTKTSVIQPFVDEIEAIFWSDKSIKDILAVYYKEDRGNSISENDVLKMWEPDVPNWQERPSILLKGGPTWTIPTCCFKPDCQQQTT